MRTLRIEIRSDSVLLDGYVNVTNRDSRPLITVHGKVVEQIEERAFDEALQRAEDVSLLVDHDRERKIGSTKEGNLKLFEDNIGLRAICTVTDADVIQKAKKGLLKGWSFGMNVIKDAIEQTNYYKISHIEKPILLIHGKEDEIVPYNHSIQLSKRIQQLSQWFPKKGNHCNIPYEMRYKFYSKFHNFIEHIKTTSIIAESQYDSKNQKEKVVKVDTIKNYINKEDPNDKVNESIQMFINGDEDTTETTTNMTSQRVSQGNNAFSYYGSIKPNFNGLFGANHYNDDDDY